MPAKISKETRQRIYEEGKPVKEIFSILKSEGIKISDKSIYNILKEKAKNRSLTSFEETLNNSTTFNESFGDENILPTLTREENKNHEVITHEGKDNNVITHEVKDDLQDNQFFHHKQGSQGRN